MATTSENIHEIATTYRCLVSHFEAELAFSFPRKLEINAITYHYITYPALVPAKRRRLGRHNIRKLTKLSRLQAPSIT